MKSRSVRWQQRFSNYQKALAQLSEFVQKQPLNKLEEQGLIQAFEYTHELAWKTLADFLRSKGHTELYGPKDSARKAFALGIIENGEIWMEMIVSRNLTSHTYNDATTKRIIAAILTGYYPAFIKLETKLTDLK
jgi:nucleotidyltransferase substrate binding protein (TIGR01987 family)